MRLDTATRILLALIALCLVILVVQRLWDGEPEPPAGEPHTGIGAADAANAARRAAPAPSAVPSPPPTEAEIHPFIEALLGDELPPEVRAWTAQQLGAIEGEEVTAALRSALEDPEPLVAAAAAAALAQRGEPGGAAPPTPSDAGEPAPPGMRVETLD